MICLRIADKKDLNIVARLAIHIWNEHYIEIIGKNQVDYMLSKMYSHKSLLEQLLDNKHVFCLINNETETIGFISFSLIKGNSYFIHKFYILQDKSNKGIGSEVLNQLIEMIQPHELFLHVNRKNFKSINFYFKNGFKILKIEDVSIGNGFEMNDFLMKKDIKY